MYNKDAKLTKFHVLVEDINKEIKNYYDDQVGKFSWGLRLWDEKLVGITPLDLIFENNCSNDFIKIILEQVKMPINDGKWNGKYTVKDLEDSSKKIIATKEFIEYYRGRKGKYGFIFWAIFGAIVEKDNFQENILLIADFAYLLNVDDKALNDIINFIKIALSQYSDDSIKLQNCNTDCLSKMCYIFRKSVDGDGVVFV